jgi:thiol:disulfide interchange protein DsbC
MSLSAPTFVIAFAIGLAIAAPADAAPNEAAIRAAVAKLAPGARIEQIRPSSLAGVSEVVVGADVLYVSDDGRHLIRGSLVDTTVEIDLTERTRIELRAAALAALPADALVRFEAASPATRRVTVFTAVDCGYCRRFHAQIDAYLAAGITIDYVLLPLGGPNSESDRVSARVHCAKDRQAAFTAATFGNVFDADDCESSYRRGIELADAFGINTTPTIIGTDGRKLGGYLTPAQLVAVMDAGAKGG